MAPILGGGWGPTFKAPGPGKVAFAARVRAIGLEDPKHEVWQVLILGCCHKEPKLSYQNSETIVFSLYPHCGNLD